jgi:Protein of unknown function (DUF2971)
MSHRELPDSVYKYLPPERIDVLTYLLIRFTPASSMNDALEFRWPTSGVDEPDKLSQRIKKSLDPHALAAFPKEKRDGLDAACDLPGFSEQWIEIQLDDIARRGSLDRNRRHKEIAEKTFQKLNANYGILSLSELPGEHQMWGHYADGGRGFLIEFDARSYWFHAMRNPDDGFNEITKVEYVSVRPAKNLLDIKDEVLYTKSDSWRYEQEWRIVRSFNDAAKRLDSEDSYGNEILLFSIPPDAIKSVILGFRSTHELGEGVRSILKSDPKLDHVEVKRATQSIETGQIEIVSLKGAVTVD